MKNKTKTCTSCNIEQPSSNFSKKPTTSDGLDYHCMICKSLARQRVRYLHIDGLTFPQHADSIHEQKVAESAGLPVPPAQYAFYGNKKLDEMSVKSRINFLTSIRYLNPASTNPLIKEIA